MTSWKPFFSGWPGKGLEACLLVSWALLLCVLSNACDVSSFFLTEEVADVARGGLGFSRKPIKPLLVLRANEPRGLLLVDLFFLSFSIVELIREPVYN